MLKAITPIDGRYASKTNVLQDYFSEYALIKYRVKVEIAYLVALHELGIGQLRKLSESDLSSIQKIIINFNIKDAQKIKSIEQTTNHDVKAVEYFIKEELEANNLGHIKEFVHFALTSQDVNNTAIPLSIKEYITADLVPLLNQTIAEIQNLSDKWLDIPMLARTHGQPASPTRLGKELRVFVERLEDQKQHLVALPIKAKFGGATGNFNAHKVAFPGIDWIAFANSFVESHLGMERSQYTTQIAHYDHLAAVFHTCSRINTIFIDFARDIWTYISMDYFGQKTIEGEVGSSAMPHKVNPIDFENAEGNLGMANAIFEFLSAKLPISRLQRDLTDSTVLRNVGSPFAHMKIALLSLNKGMSKLVLNANTIDEDLSCNWMVVAEGIQNILRREGYPNPYEALKALTRGKSQIGQQEMHNFINGLEVSDAIKAELKSITPQNYIGILP